MYTALYYPHINIENDNLIRNALLLWDKLEYISPSLDRMPWHKNPDYQEALSIIAEPHVPTDEEKKSAHEIILELATSDLPQWFFFNPENQDISYNIHPNKFIPETWDALEELKLVNTNCDTYLTAPSFGLSMMSILADCCSGTQSQLITDEVDSYSALTRYLTEINGGEYELASEGFDRIVTISIKTINLKNIEIKSLASYRKRESNSNGAQLRALRHNYLEKINEYVERLVNESKTKKDKIEIERQFEQNMRDDLNNLCEELKVEAKKVVFSKEMAVAVLATAGTIIEPYTSTIIGIGALYKKKVEYKASRKKTLEQHPMSWLYESKHFKIY